MYSRNSFAMCIDILITSLYCFADDRTRRRRSAFQCRCRSLWGYGDCKGDKRSGERTHDLRSLWGSILITMLINKVYKAMNNALNTCNTQQCLSRYGLILKRLCPFAVAIMSFCSIWQEGRSVLYVAAKRGFERLDSHSLQPLHSLNIIHDYVPKRCWF